MVYLQLKIHLRLGKKCLILICRLRSAETVTASLPLAFGLTNKDERWINFNFNSVSRMCKSDDDIS